MPKRLYLRTVHEKTICSETKMKQHGLVHINQIKLVKAPIEQATEIVAELEEKDGRILTVMVELALDLSVVLELEMIFSDGDRANFAVSS